MPSTVFALATHRFLSPCDHVFRAWLDTEQVTRWMELGLKSMGLPGVIGRIEIDPRVGGKFQFSDHREEGEAIHFGTYTVISPPSELQFTWFTDPEETEEASLVTLTFEKSPDGCIATITHEIDAAWADYIPQTERGWKAFLQAIDQNLQTNPA